MDEYKITTHSVEETLEIAQNLESEKFPGMVICLNGELGSGKTVFVKGFASGLGIQESITSPTFTIVKEYLDGEAPLYHMDVYRINESDQSVGIEDYFDKDGISIIEWAELIEDKLPENRLDISFVVIDENTRILKFTPHGEVYENLCHSVL
ncbi:MAG: tRNA (adenosine(37)-N6)-threonylcarbamoyltransferase complex ATPase subunit type 1 TsaE [Bacilli bacterium]|nr:tRNA (adenosine(37)-N6)-threonylcarbamoyltransferase complex ATPase subunit type 1 TsaE [Bacilli bacterium]